MAERPGDDPHRLANSAEEARSGGEVPAVTYRKVTVSPDEEGLWALDEKGSVKLFGDPDEVVRWVKGRDSCAARRGKSTVTLIDWVGMPEGFTPPHTVDTD